MIVTCFLSCKRPALLEFHVGKNDVRHRALDTVHIPQTDGKGAGVVNLCDILDPFITDVLIGAAMEGGVL